MGEATAAYQGEVSDEIGRLYAALGARKLQRQPDFYHGYRS